MNPAKNNRKNVENPCMRSWEAFVGVELVGDSVELDIVGLDDGELDELDEL